MLLNLFLFFYQNRYKKNMFSDRRKAPQQASHFMRIWNTVITNEWESPWNNAVLSTCKLKAHSKRENVRRNQDGSSSLTEVMLLQLHSLGPASMEAKHGLLVGTHRGQCIYTNTCSWPCSWHEQHSHKHRQHQWTPVAHPSISWSPQLLAPEYRWVSEECHGLTPPADT